MPTILHVDMDAFFAAVEVLLDPTLAGQPVVVGGTEARGVVAAASYEARRFGVRSAMPSARARRLCPQAVFLPGRYDTYAEFSRRIHAIFQTYTPLVEGIALDEAFLDVTIARARPGDGATVGRRIRSQLREEVGLWASVGVASSKLLAKLASEEAKPWLDGGRVVPGAGVVEVEGGKELAFLHPMPIEALWGVGPATAARLAALGVATIGDLAEIPVDTLVRTLGSANGHRLHELAWARDTRPVEPDRAVQSISQEETYPEDRTDRAGLHRELVRLSDTVASRLRAAEVTGRTVTLKLRYGDFTTITRSRTLDRAIDTGPVLARAAGWLLDQVDIEAGIRLLGVAVSNLVAGAPHQLALPLEATGSGRGRPGAADAGPAGAGPAPVAAMTDSSWQEAARAVDRIRSRFGAQAVGPAALIGRDGLTVKRRGDQQWGPSEEPET